MQQSSGYAATISESHRAAASKWTAITHIRAFGDIDPAEVCAVGDDRNDIPMIADAGLGVATRHARPEVRAVANHITATNAAADSVARLIDEVLLA